MNSLCFAMDKSGNIKNKCLKGTFHFFLCFIVLDLIFLNLRSLYAGQSGVYSGRRNSNGMRRNSNDRRRILYDGKRDSNHADPCVGYGKFKTNRKQWCKKRLPNCLIIGAAKAGTYVLLRFLSAHPQVVRNENINEYDFFSSYYKNGVDWYKDKMPYSLPGQIILEKSPGYFPHPEAPMRVFRMDPNINLILIVRHPIHRSVSAYAMNKAKVEEGRKSIRSKTQTFEPFEAQWKHFIQFYDKYFENWLQYFKLSQIHIVDGDMLAKDPINEMKMIETFLHIDPYFDSNVFIYNATKGFYCLRSTSVKNLGEEFDMDCMHEGKGRHHPNVSENVMKEMQKLYLPHNQRFYQISRRYFDWDTV